MHVARAEGLTKTTSVTKGGRLEVTAQCTNAPSSKSTWQLLLPHTSAPGVGYGPVEEQLDWRFVGDAELGPRVKLEGTDSEGTGVEDAV